jgi:hypothetical protein
MIWKDKHLLLLVDNLDFHKPKMEARQFKKIIIVTKQQRRKQ